MAYVHNDHIHFPLGIWTVVVHTILLRQSIHKEGFSRSRRSEDKLVPVADPVGLHGQIGKVNFNRYAPSIRKAQLKAAFLIAASPRLKEKASRCIRAGQKPVVFLKVSSIARKQRPEKLQLVVGIFRGDDALFEKGRFDIISRPLYLVLIRGYGNVEMGIDQELVVSGNILQQAVNVLNAKVVGGIRESQMPFPFEFKL